MMFVFVTERWVLDARRGGRRERGARAAAEAPEARRHDSYTSGTALAPPPSTAPCCLSSMPSPLPSDDVLTAEPPALVWLAPAPREGLWGVPAGGAGGY